MSLIDMIGCIYDDFLWCECYLIGLIPACVCVSHTTNTMCVCFFFFFCLALLASYPVLFFGRWSNRKGRWRRKGGCVVGLWDVISVSLSLSQEKNPSTFYSLHLILLPSVQFLLYYCYFLVFARQLLCRLLSGDMGL